MNAADIKPSTNPTVLRRSAAKLKRVANYYIPAEVERRISDLRQRGETLTADENRELQGWLEFTQSRAIERAEALKALRQLLVTYPELTE